MLLTFAEPVSNTNYSKTTINPLVTPAFMDKPWKIKSIITNPSVLDIDGDGSNDAEIIKSLQQAERNREFIFGADGTVWERKIAEGNQQEEPAAIQNGTWIHAKEDLLRWTQDDHTLIDLRVVSQSENELKLGYEADAMKVIFTMRYN